MSDNCATNPKGCESEVRKCECRYQPSVDIFEQADEIVLIADLPGAMPETIELDFEDGELSVKAHVEPRQDADTKFVVREYGTGDYHRKFRVSEVVNAEQIKASYTDGVLTVHLPKTQAAKPRRVAISTN